MTVADPSIAPAVKPARTCKWLVSHDLARDLIAHGVPCPCKTTDRRGRKVEESYYFVSRHPYQAGVWLIRKEQEDGDGPAYSVDTSWSSDCKEWCCDHAQVCGYTQKIAVGCRHACLLAALLKTLEIEA